MSFSSSSSSESYSPPKSPSSLQNFDPFAVHPFTNCSQVGQSSSSLYTSNKSYAGAYPGNYNNQFNANAPQTPSMPSPSSPSRSPSIPYGYQQKSTGIFEQFQLQKETSLPELDDVLRSNKSPVKTTISSGRYNPSKPIPIAQPRKF